MQPLKRIFAIVLALFFVMGAHIPVAWGLDVYVVYAGKVKKQKSQLVKQLPGDLSVKSYNVDLLALADYSGKQKAISKLSKARLVVILEDPPLEILDGSKFKTDLVITNSNQTTVTSDKWTLYVVTDGVDVSKLGKRSKILHAATPGDLQDKDAISSASVVVVDGKALELYQAVSLIAKTRLQ